jgi:quercetin dioxygenase-like cupin family protein
MQSLREYNEPIRGALRLLAFLFYDKPTGGSNTMKKRFTVVVASILALVCLAFGQSDKDKMAGQSQTEASSGHVLVTSNDVKWGPAPPALPPGAQFAVIEGDPSKAGGTFTIRLKAPDGYKVPPHWHPVAENVTVLEGTFMVGMGDKFDQSAGKELKPGSFASMPKGMRHFAWTKGETIIQVHGVGPFELIYVNAADDPRKSSSTR